MNGKDEKETIVEPNKKQEPKDDNKPEFTPEQQAYIDHIIGGINAKNKQKLAEVTANNDKTIKKQVQAQIAEEKRRAEMTAEQKAAEDIKKLQDDNKQLQSQLAQRDRLSFGHSIASKYHVPSNMVSRLLGQTNDETEKNMKDFSDSFIKAVQAGVDDRLAGTKQPQQDSAVSVDSDKKLSDYSLEEQTRIYKENPELYNQLASR